MPGIYLHIPFCKQACHYCDFHFSTTLKEKRKLLDALRKEIVLQREFFGPGRATLDTVYFGGGSPSILTGDEIKALMLEIEIHFSFADDVEITLEANPDDLDSEKLKALKEAGINRLSIGIQSFEDADLMWMNRVHSASQAVGSVKRAQQAGFSNITIDLIYGTPMLTDEKWKNNLKIAFDLNVQHLSCYALTVEPRTALAHRIEEKKEKNIDDKKQAVHFEMLMDLAEQNGFEQYEISNFAKDNKYSRHNSSYWRGEKYLGIGPSAHSFNGIERQWNVKNNMQYIQSLAEGKIPFEKETLTPENKFNEYVMTSLRTMWGCNLETIRRNFGDEIAAGFFKQAIQYVNDGMMLQQKQNFILTKKGKLFADRMAAELFVL
jgi:oxygen-independent coproporphyrinogen-3 oxidase